jgi:hypothetical protein
MDGRTCVPVGAGLLMLMGNLEDAARAIQPDDDDDPIVPMSDDLGLVESHPGRPVQCVIELIAPLINRKGRRSALAGFFETAFRFR